jgi:chromosome segregation ATPase
MEKQKTPATKLNMALDEMTADPGLKLALSMAQAKIASLEGRFVQEILAHETAKERWDEWKERAIKLENENREFKTMAPCESCEKQIQALKEKLNDVKESYEAEIQELERGRWDAVVAAKKSEADAKYVRNSLKKISDMAEERTADLDERDKQIAMLKAELKANDTKRRNAIDAECRAEKEERVAQEALSAAKGEIERLRGILSAVDNAIKGNVVSAPCVATEATWPHGSDMAKYLCP